MCVSDLMSTVFFSVLDLHGTGVKQAVRGVLNAADLGNTEDAVTPPKFDQMCRVTA